jgi:Na+/proline symporter
VYNTIIFLPFPIAALKNSAAMADTSLGQGAGYGIIIGFGALFALGMWGLAVLLAKFHNEVQGSEMFMTAKRSVKTGLVASAVVSSWTIAATLLTSSTWAYEFGVSGAYYYGAGATVQIFVSGEVFRCYLILNFLGICRCSD